MVTPISGNATFQGPSQGTEAAYQPPFPRPEVDPFPTQASDDLVEAQQRATQQAAQRAEKAKSEEPSRPRFDAPQIGVQFRVLQDIGITQARVVDRISREVLREVPTTDALQFRASFDRVLGQFLDVEA
ncbi:MAG: flagellar protein FlaG [Planctomycetota bacterium]